MNVLGETPEPQHNPQALVSDQAPVLVNTTPAPVPPQLLGIVTMVCHTVVLVAIIAGLTVLAADHALTATGVGGLAALGGMTGTGLVMNGRKYGAGQ